MEKQGLISSIKTPSGQRRFSKENIEKYLQTSQNFEAPQNPSRFKKTYLTVGESKAAYHTIPFIKGDELFYHNDPIWIYNTDILKTNCIQENSIDLIVTSPPYNVDIKYNSHDDTMTYNDYLSFTKEWIAQCYKFIKNDGRFCLNIHLGGCPTTINSIKKYRLYCDLKINIVIYNR
ncbi:hypothetical protein JXL19_07040, partial [bacterium]|nr:hypothetical protein [bacterium]